MKDNLTRNYVKKAAEAIYKELIRRKIAVEKRRPDGRGTDEIRPIACEVGISPRTHGSALFIRGETQILTLLTLGTAKEGQRIDDLSLESERRYMHHYNFPPYSVGETGFMRGPKRRDIGHGALAQRALEPVIPGTDEFPYTIRLVSETLESNGSSSMGSVCGSTLALMDAGVPIKRPVSGIAMGLVKEGDDHVILTDIQGAEDHLGDMDFKVAGTREGITALQMDIKITGVTQEIMRNALAQAKQARGFILDRMAEALPESREQLAAHAPRITTISIDPEQIGLIIGKGGETIRGLESDYEVQIDIEEDGTILIYATEGEKADAAIAAIQGLTKEPEVGDTYTGKVVKTTDFGAFVELKKGTDGLLHVSNVGPGRVGHIEDVISRGDVLDVVVQEVDKARGRIGLKLVGKHENGTVVQPEELIERAKDAPPRERRERDGDRGPRRGGGGAGAAEAVAAGTTASRKERPTARAGGALRGSPGARGRDRLRRSRAQAEEGARQPAEGVLVGRGAEVRARQEHERVVRRDRVAHERRPERARVVRDLLGQLGRRRSRPGRQSGGSGRFSVPVPPGRRRPWRPRSCSSPSLRAASSWQRGSREGRRPRRRSLRRGRRRSANGRLRAEGARRPARRPLPSQPCPGGRSRRRWRRPSPSSASSGRAGGKRECWAPTINVRTVRM